ncbi:M23 family metallopeptidase [Micromonospora sp. NPDC092111]|uniref:M23 family metallopeptidase n=1 Tax=Micromonospora sp. NPDC092111 TaxID=3364289 RepID=UPI0038139E6D
MSSRSSDLRRPRPAYPVLLLAAALLGGCGTGGRPASAPVWDSPSGVTTADQPAAPTGTPSPAPDPAALRRVFPVRAANVAYQPTHSGYPGTDIFADCGEPVVAVTDGTVLEVSRVDRFDKRGPLGPYNGGLSVSLLGDDGVRYYGSHLSVISAGIDAGVRVRAGRQLGEVGRTGNANNVCHLHFGLSPKCTGHDDWWIRRGVVWPAGYLDSWRGKGNRSPVAAVAAWERKNGCPRAPKGTSNAG